MVGLVQCSTEWLNVDMTTNTETLDRIFFALGNSTRRTILKRLARSEATVTEIAAPFDTSLNAISKHLKVLEDAGLIVREISGREHICRLNPKPLDDAVAWITANREFWQKRLDALEQQLVAKKAKRDRA